MSMMPVGGLVPRVTDNAAELVVRNAKIHTGDPVRPQAEAIAIRDGVITVVGDDNGVASHVGPDTKVVDALGRLGMGLQNAVARRLGVPDLTTTVLTLTLTGLAADSTPAGGAAPRPGRRILSVPAMFLGAFVGAQLVLHGHLVLSLSLALLLLAVTCVTAHRLSAADPPGPGNPPETGTARPRVAPDNAAQVARCWGMRGMWHENAPAHQFQASMSPVGDGVYGVKPWESRHSRGDTP
ncbi:DUF1275 family protein [Streptomyces sp. R35]|uniref:DUF1275 family protein n=1 Tax=Streptomyces sp. R35 TaxID=3238630 RepID=A0AB39SQ40_9ACTN